MKLTEKMPPELRKELEKMDDILCDIRLFANGPSSVRTLHTVRELRYTPDEKQLHALVQQLCDHMLRLSPEKTAQGFITLEGGHRMGLCGRVTQKEGQMVLQEIGSVCIRVAHEVKGCAAQAAEEIMRHREGVMICGAPGSGKTTLLRDLVRWISDAGVAVGLSDERGEIAACVQGVPQLDVGKLTHVLDGCPKAQSLRWLIRGLCPQVLAMDELYGREEYACVRAAHHCGITTIATAHAGSVKMLSRRRDIRVLMEEGVFGQVIFVENGKIQSMERAADVICCGR